MSSCDYGIKNQRVVVDITFGTGLLTYDEVCKRVETMALRTDDEVKTQYLESQVPFRFVSALRVVDAKPCCSTLRADIDREQ